MEPWSTSAVRIRTSLWAPGDVGRRRGQPGAVRRYVHIVEVGEIVQAGQSDPVAVRRVALDDRGQADVVPDGPEGLVGRIEGQVADPGVLDQRLRAAGRQVDRGQVPQGVVVGRVEDAMAGLVVGQGGHRIEHGPLMSQIRSMRPLWVSRAAMWATWPG